MLALYDPLDKLCATKACRTLATLEYVVFGFFFMEMIVKLTALGIYGKKSYFKDKWNIFDFLIVITGIVDVAGLTKGGFVTIARVGRILRPLRAINRVPSIRILVSLLMDTIPMLGNVLVLAFLVFACFGIIGVQMFQGRLRNRCFVSSKIGNYSSANYSTENSSSLVSISSYRSSEFYKPPYQDFVCNIDVEDSCSGVPPKIPYKRCDDHFYNNSNPKPNYTDCRDHNLIYRECKKSGANPYYGSIGFDNIAMSFVFIYQVVTLEGWGNLMYLIQDAYSFWTWIYFVTLIIVGSFFLVNLALVVITMQFSETKHRETRLMKKQKNLTSSQLSLYSDLCNLWYKIRHCMWCTKGFQSIHHIHQHVHVRQEPFYCQQCKKSSTQECSQAPREPHNIPNIEISCFDDANSPNYGLKRSVSYPGLVSACAHAPDGVTSGKDAVKVGKLCNSFTGMENMTEQNEMVLMKNKPDGSVQDSKALSSLTPCCNHLAPTLSPSHYGSNLSPDSSSNTISVHAESIAAVKVGGVSCNSINSHTSLSLMINSPNGEIRTKTYVDTGISNSKNGSHVTTLSGTECNIDSNIQDSMNVTPSTDFSSEVCYDSMFDLRVCDKYYVSHEPTTFQRFRLFCKRFPESSKVSYFIMGVIVVNTVCMAVEHHNEPDRLTEILKYCNIVFILIFFLEMVLKMLGVGIKIYFKSGFNCFDFAIVVLSIAELCFDNVGRTFMILRSLRLLRVFRLVRPMRHQIAVMLQTTSSVMTFFALLFLFMFTFAILGMNLFGGKFEFEGKQERSNFDSFVFAMVTVFQILTQEDWNKIMYNGIRATNNWATLYFLSLMTIGYYVLLNLLVAILVEGFTTPLEKQRMAQRLLSMIRQNRKFTMNRTVSLPDIRVTNTDEENIVEEPDDEETSGLLKSHRTSTRRRTCSDIWQGLTSDMFVKDTVPQLSPLLPASVRCVKQKSKKNDPILLGARTTNLNGDVPTFVEWKSIKSESVQLLNRKDETLLSQLWCSCVSPHFLKERGEWALYLFSKENRLRKILIVVTRSRYFDAVILILIIYSCVLLGLETPEMNPKGKLREIIDISSFALSWVFFLEMGMKVIADGFVSTKDSYLRNGWNVLDFSLVLTSMIDIFFTLYHSSNGRQGRHTDIIKGFRVLRATRALRPLRMIRKAPGLKLVVQTLLYSLKPIGNTVLIAAFFYIIFGILGVQLMRGAFYYCSGDYKEFGQVHNKNECLIAEGGYWVNYQYNFDNVFEALMALFIISTKDGWVDIMHRGIDAVGVDQQPKINQHPWRILYFISFLLICGFLVLNMIVGVVVENFQRCQELQEDQDKAKAIIEKWKLCMKKSSNTYWLDYAPWRKKIYKACKHKNWNITITAVIFANILVMAMEHYEMSEAFKRFLDYSNFLFTGIYVIEASLLITAFGFRRYFSDKWYVFDMVIVVVSVLSIALENLISDSHKADFGNTTAIKALRLLRVVRALKLLKAAKGLRFLLDHVAETIPQVTNLGLLFSLLFFVYSCLGMQLFGTLECNTKYPCAGLGKHANFKSLGTSMLTLFRIATGDNWSGILKDTLRPLCDDSNDCNSNCCITQYVSPLFFVTFVLFAQFVLVNVVIAVIMKHLHLPEEKMKEKMKRRSQKGKSTDGKNMSISREREVERNTFRKWQAIVKRNAAARQLNETVDKETLGIPHVRVKRSTDDLNDIPMLKYYCAKSLSPAYDQCPQLYVNSEDTSNYLGRTLTMMDSPLRKSSCPPVITSAPYRSYLEELSGLSGNNDALSNNLEVEGRSVFSQRHCPECAYENSVDNNGISDAHSIVLTRSSTESLSQISTSEFDSIYDANDIASPYISKDLNVDINTDEIVWKDERNKISKSEREKRTRNREEVIPSLVGYCNGAEQTNLRLETQPIVIVHKDGPTANTEKIIYDRSESVEHGVPIIVIDSGSTVKESTDKVVVSHDHLVVDIFTNNEGPDVDVQGTCSSDDVESSSEDCKEIENSAIELSVDRTMKVDVPCESLDETVSFNGACSHPREKVSSDDMLPNKKLCEKVSNKTERSFSHGDLSRVRKDMKESPSRASLCIGQRTLSKDSSTLSSFVSICSLNTTDDSVLRDDSSLGSYIIIPFCNDEESVK